jgi:hypothetical protein
MHILTRRANTKAAFTFVKIKPHATSTRRYPPASARAHRQHSSSAQRHGLLLRAWESETERLINAEVSRETQPYARTLDLKKCQKITQISDPRPAESRAGRMPPRTSLMRLISINFTVRAPQQRREPCALVLQGRHSPREAAMTSLRSCDEHGHLVASNPRTSWQL